MRHCNYQLSVSYCKIVFLLILRTELKSGCLNFRTSVRITLLQVIFSLFLNPTGPICFSCFSLYLFNVVIVLYNKFFILCIIYYVENWPGFTVFIPSNHWTSSRWHTSYWTSVRLQSCECRCAGTNGQSFSATIAAA
jgi:hypothetical protein